MEEVKPGCFISTENTGHQSNYITEVTDAGPSTSKRIRKRRLDLNHCFSVSNFICSESYCGLTLPDEESLDKHYKQHLEQEFGKLEKLRIKKNTSDTNNDTVNLRNKRNNVFESLKLRREARTRKRTSDFRNSSVGDGEVLHDCPLCHIAVQGTCEDLKKHFSGCLRVHNSHLDNEYIDVDEEDYEEYEWAGQRRIRSTSMFKGGLKAAGFLTIKQTQEDEVLDVTGDDDVEIGAPQYKEKDLLRIEDELLESTSNNSSISINKESPTCDLNLDSSVPTLKNSPMCKICMSNYSNPLTSITCWHVHCERCWLLALGAKKLCPQCKEIVTPGDLRKIFL